MKFSRVIMAASIALGLSFGAGAATAAERIKTYVLDETADAMPTSYTVKQLWVIVPRSLEVSEAMNFLPDADIVWRADPIGDRYEQVDKVATDAMLKGVAPLSGPREVEVVVQIERFHCLTERARAYVGGWYAIRFYLQLRDAETHAVISDTVLFDVTKTALGRKAAIVQELSGNTQKVVVSEHLSRMIRVALAQMEQMG